MAEIVLTIGDVEFANTEVPEHINFGGEQMLASHDLPGGKRIVDAMGAFEADKRWSGWFLGEDATDRARELDAIRKKGEAVQLTWDVFSYSVVVKEFTARYERFYQVAYEIVCHVIEDKTTPYDPASKQLDAQLGDDASLAVTQAGKTGNTGILGAITNIASSIQNVTSMITAPLATVSAIAGQITDAYVSVNNQIIAAEQTFNGVVDIADTLGGSADAFDKLVALRELSPTLGRMQTNMAAFGQAGSQISAVSGSLYRIATDAYGDVTQWSRIAEKNGITDPQQAGVYNDLLIPKVKDPNKTGIIDNAILT